MYFQYTYQKPILAEWQEGNKEFSKQMEYNYHTADLLSLVKVSGKSHCSAKRISPWRTLDGLVLLGFLGLLLGSPASGGGTQASLAHGSQAASS